MKDVDFKDAVQGILAGALLYESQGDHVLANRLRLIAAFLRGRVEWEDMVMEEQTDGAVE